MNKDFDFDNISKRMPYTMPDGTLDKLEENVWTQIKSEYLGDASQEAAAPTMTVATPSRKRHYTIRALVAVAAAVALLVVVTFGFKKPTPPTMNDVDKAFCQLNQADQAFLLEVYQEDVFMNE